MSTLTAAIQFGSSRISAVAASIDSNGDIVVHGIESVPTTGCIRHGCVVNIQETAVCIKSVMKKLSNRVVTFGFGELNAAYVGVCGISMHSMQHNPKVIVNDEHVITPDLHEQLKQKGLSLPIPGTDILGIETNRETIEGDYAEAEQQLILAEKKLLNGIRAAMDRARIRIVDTFATPLLIGDILNEEEKREGCVLLDLGAQLSTISIYKDNELKMLSTLPLGGDSVTMDIATKGMRMEEAEEAKVNWTNASPQWSEDLTKNASQKLQIPIEDLNLIVVSRYDEIISNIAHLIEKAGYKGLLDGGCIVTGGSSVQLGLTSLLRKRLDISKISTRACSTPRFSNSERKPHLTSLMVMLKHCSESCEVVKVEVPVKPEPAPPVSEKVSTPAPKSSSSNDSSRKVKGGLKGFFGDLFSGLDDDQ